MKPVGFQGADQRDLIGGMARLGQGEVCPLARR